MNDYKPLAKFFFYAFLDEAIALKAAQAAASELFRTEDESDPLINFVQVTEKYGKRFYNYSASGVAPVLTQFHSEVSVEPWWNVRKKCYREELFAIIWIAILGLPLETVARALHTNSGNIKSRLSSGLQKLAEYLPSTAVGS